MTLSKEEAVRLKKEFREFYNKESGSFTGYDDISSWWLIKMKEDLEKKEGEMLEKIAGMIGINMNTMDSPIEMVKFVSLRFPIDSKEYLKKVDIIASLTHPKEGEDK